MSSDTWPLLPLGNGSKFDCIKLAQFLFSWNFIFFSRIWVPQWYDDCVLFSSVYSRTRMFWTSVLVLQRRTSLASFTPHRPISPHTNPLNCFFCSGNASTRKFQKPKDTMPEPNSSCSHHLIHLFCSADGGDVAILCCRGIMRVCVCLCLSVSVSQCVLLTTWFFERRLCCFIVVPNDVICF